MTLQTLFNKWWVPVVSLIFIVTLTFTVASLVQLTGLALLLLFCVTLSVHELAVTAVRYPRNPLWFRYSRLGFTGMTLTHSALAAGFAVAGLVLIALLAFVLGGVFELSSSVGISPYSLGILIVGSVLEEVAFRGTLLESLQQRFGIRTAVLMTSVLFGLAHAANPGVNLAAVFNVTLAGIVFALFIVHSNSLWPAISFHVVWNLAVKTFFGIVSGQGHTGWVSTLNTRTIDEAYRVIIAGPFGIEQGFLTSFILLGCIVGILFLMPYHAEDKNFSAIAVKDQIAGTD